MNLIMSLIEVLFAVFVRNIAEWVRPETDAIRDKVSPISNLEPLLGPSDYVNPQFHMSFHHFLLSF